MLLRIAKQSAFLQKLYIALSASIHPLIKHNAGKIEIFKAAFWHAAMEKVEGSYFEFGVYEGASLLSAVKIHETISSKNSAEFLGAKFDRRFYGFDSFEDGFRYNEKHENHSVFREGSFQSSYERCRSRLRKYKEVTLIKGYFEDTIVGKTPAEIPASEKCAIAFIDCDLKTPARIALNFLAPLLQRGSVIILDDVFSYKGNPLEGVNGAWLEFMQGNPNLKARPFFNYGCSGQSYIFYEV